MRFGEYYLKEDETTLAVEPITSLSTDVKGDDLDFHSKLKQLLNVKFAEVGKHIKELTRPASKGMRKGLLIFVPDAANRIYQIEDEFVKFIVRDIYDHYRDITRGILWQVHMNWLFSGDIMMELMKELNPRVKELHIEKEKAKGEIKQKQKQPYEATRKYDFWDWSYKDPKSFFYVHNPASKPFWDIYNKFLEKVKTEHPRVPVEKISKYIDKDYNYREKSRKIVKDFLETIPEYKKNHDEWSNLLHKEMEVSIDYDNKIKEEVEKVNYSVLKKEVEAMVNQFVKMIANSIVAGSIKENYTI